MICAVQSLHRGAAKPRREKTGDRMIHETAASIAPVVPEQRAGEPEPVPAPPQPVAPAEPAHPVPFDRLLAVATLTPGQASLVAARLLRAGGSAAASSTASCRLGQVSFTPSGDIEVAVASAEEDTPLTDLLQRLLQNARRLPAHPKPEQHLLLHRLEEAAAAPVPDPETRADGLEEALASTLGSGAHQRLSAQLAALVAGRRSHVVPSVLTPPDPSQAAVGPATRRTRSPGLVPAAPERSRGVGTRAAPAPTGPNRAARRRTPRPPAAGVAGWRSSWPSSWPRSRPAPTSVSSTGAPGSPSPWAWAATRPRRPRRHPPHPRTVRHSTRPGGTTRGGSRRSQLGMPGPSQPSW